MHVHHQYASLPTSASFSSRIWSLFMSSFSTFLEVKRNYNYNIVTNLGGYFWWQISKVKLDFTFLRKIFKITYLSLFGLTWINKKEDSISLLWKGVHTQGIGGAIELPRWLEKMFQPRLFFISFFIVILPKYHPVMNYQLFILAQLMISGRWDQAPLGSVLGVETA